jgi:uncharacterized membrane protein
MQRVRHGQGRAWGVAAGVAMLALGLPSAVAQTPALGERPALADPELGRDLATRLCSGCHLVEPEHVGPVVDGVPTFMRIAEDLDDEAIEVMMLAPSHPAMPEAPLTRLERQHVIAHIRSLAE